MEKFKVILTNRFKEKLDKRDKRVLIWFDKILAQVKNNPYLGKPLRSDIVREMKFENFRVYFIIFKK